MSTIEQRVAAFMFGGHVGEPLPDGLTPHSLRRTFASLLFALGEPPPYVMAQMAHTTATLTLAIYARQMDRRDGEPERLAALMGSADLSPDRRGADHIAAEVGDARVPPSLVVATRQR